MRIIKALAAAGLALSATAMGTAAQAHDYDHGRYDHGRDYRDARYDRGDRYDRYDYDRGRHYGWNRGYGFRDHRHCWTEWRYHRRVTICR